MTPDQRARAEDLLPDLGRIVGLGSRWPHLQDEVMGVAREALCVAAMVWDPAFGKPFNMFAYGFVRRRVHDFIRSWTGWNHNSGNHNMVKRPLELDPYTMDQAEPSHEEEITEAAHWEWLRGELSPNIKEIYELLASGLQKQEVAALLNMRPNLLSYYLKREKDRFAGTAYR